ncbi:hypothetical protein CONPUDRAFT_82046 [Coniophora puteana RWD-64-598 SS2]|uniref:Uncharacterized protein n=1 Tax=Coniophora puteana (strain RWD-64-598) TaxID=741705 RepID=A0A5M3MP23_CONPW|nr:uncharacterized protein CONPUDRAFT_82046 [Coniophora puteana RWD-64-598 SS2]EIW80928.1 hypothetical protein CONPUDRAFT_82046 [Coniophora puteana RWD-64-598 SS2]
MSEKVWVRRLKSSPSLSRGHASVQGTRSHCLSGVGGVLSAEQLLSLESFQCSEKQEQSITSRSGADVALKDAAQV